MRDFSIKHHLQKYSTLVIPIIAVGLIQFIQCYENWDPDKETQAYHQKSYDFSNAELGRGSADNFKNIPLLDNNDNISRHFSLEGDDGFPPKLALNNIIAYRRTLHNVSWAITIPVFTFLLPIADSGDPVTLGNQALYGFFAALIVIIGYAIPILFNGQIPGARSLENNKITLSHLMHPGHLVNLVGVNFQNQIGVDPMQCLQKTVCEAYRSPQNERYGILAKPFQYFFPAKNISDESARSIYELAARDGKFRDTDCKKKYECMFDVLDLGSYFLSVYKRSRAKEKENAGQGYSNGKDNEFQNKLMFR